MATITVLDASNNPQAVEKPNANGRQAAAGSRPVALSTEDLASIDAITAKLITSPATAAAQTTGNASLTSIDGKTPALVGGLVPVVTPVNATTTRAYNLAAAIRPAFSSASSAEAALPTLGASREIRFAASARCWVKWGATGLTAAAAEAASFVLEANAPEVIAIPAGATHYRVIRDTADGSLLMTPVA